MDSGATTFPGNLWFRLVVAGIGAQFIVLCISLLLVTCLFAGVSSGGAALLSWSALLTQVKGLLSESYPTGIDPLWRTAYYSSSLLIIAVWQALFISKIITRPHRFIFSKELAFYDKDEKSLDERRRKDQIVFRMMNDGLQDIYDVKIRVIFRYFNTRTQSYQHFNMQVQNYDIPVLSRGMPFRIHVDTGRIENIGFKMFMPFYAKEDGASNPDDIITLADVSSAMMSERLGRDAYALIVYAQGFDAELNQLKATVWSYPLLDIKRGYFAEIEPRHGRAGTFAGSSFFDRSEVRRKFNLIEPRVEALSRHS